MHKLTLMPRAGRHIVAGRTNHLTHRCHNRDYLLRIAVDCDAYRQMLELLGDRRENEFRQNYSQAIEDALQGREQPREGRWTESLAVGSEAFAREVGAQIRNRMDVDIQTDMEQPSVWVVKEVAAVYG